MFTNIHNQHYTETCKCIFLSDGDFIQCETCKCIQADCIDEPSDEDEYDYSQHFGISEDNEICCGIDCPANSKRGE